MNDNQRPCAPLERSSYRLCVIMAVAGLTVVLYSTTWGAAISPDSVTYVGAARNLVAGHGLSVREAGGQFSPMTHFPPLFPMLIAIPGILGIDPLDTARWLNALVFSANILLVGLAVYRYTSGTVWLSVLGSFLMLTSFNMLVIHSTAITEPLFILFGISGLLLLDIHIEERRPLSLLFSAIAVALALLTRYAGGALVISGAAALILLSRTTFRKLLAEVARFVLVSCFPALLWFLRNELAAGTVTNRQLAFHPPSREQLDMALDTFSRWLMPLKTAGLTRDAIVLAGLLVLLALGGGVVFLNRPWGRRPPTCGTGRVPYIFVIFVAVYVGFLLVSLAFFDAHSPLDVRILSPVFVSGLIIVLHLIDALLRSVRGTRLLEAAIVSVCLFFTLSYLGSGAIWAMRSHRDGRGYASRSWQQSEIIARVRSQPEGTLIYSNGPDAIHILTGRYARGLPARFNPGTRSVYDTHTARLDSIRDELAEHGGVLVYFNTITHRDYLPSEHELKEAMPLVAVASEGDGSIYRVADIGR